MAAKTGGLGEFDYEQFKKELDEQGFMGRQTSPLNMRLDLLESFLSTDAATNSVKRNILTGAPGLLTIVDLTDPVIDADSACVLFDICLSIFLSLTKCGTIVTLDEAHNYMTESSAAAGRFTNGLLKTIREQRHQCARVVIATQEPTINTALLDLCSIIMVHRCTSPAWFTVLKRHVAGLYLSENPMGNGGGDECDDVFSRIVRLQLGESLLFCPMAAVGIDERGGVQKMEHRFMTMRTRKRVTADGGVTRLAEDSR
jgi:hypothetical protein